MYDKKVKNAIKVLVAVSCTFICFALVFYFNQDKQITENVQFRKVEINQNNDVVNSFCSREEFDLESIITVYDDTFNTLVFQGKITGLDEYELSWTDENGDVFTIYK